MADYVFRGKPVWIASQVGIVHAHRQWTQTDVSSFGGTGNSAPYISSTTKHHQSFWIVSPDGNETEVSPPSDFPCREGQEVMLVWGNKKPYSTGGYFYIYNMTIDRGMVIKDRLYLLRNLILMFIFRSIIYACLLFFMLLVLAIGRISDDYAAPAVIGALIFGFLQTMFSLIKADVERQNFVRTAFRNALAEYREGEA